MPGNTAIRGPFLVPAEGQNLIPIIRTMIKCRIQLPKKSFFMWDLQGHGLHSALPLGDEFFLPTSPDACFSSRQVRIALGFLQKTLPSHSILILRVDYGPP